jgi:pimeloyl-ACP methyl ester carboxylesterase
LIEPSILPLPGERRLAYHRIPGKRPGVLFCGGYTSDMTGTKALALEAFCREQGRAFVRFDYTGHGASSGDFVDGTIGGWTDDALAIVDRLTEGPLLVVGSSMGGWIMLLVALARPQRIAGLIGVGAASRSPARSTCCTASGTLTCPGGPPCASPSGWRPKRSPWS